MILDTHHHLWEFNDAEYGWMDGAMSILKRDYLPPDLEKQLEGSAVTGTIAVQARQTVEETRWLLELADQYAFLKGIVGWVDICSNQLTAQLNELSSNPWLVGVRHVVQDEPDDDFILRPAFIKGMEKLVQHNLTYDLLIYPRHLENTIELISLFPDQRFVLDHIAKPDIKAGVLKPWQEQMAALAEFPNVWCKVSGMVTEAHLQRWKYEDFLPYLDTVAETFGPDRIMLGSDWPVCRLAGEYHQVMEIPVRYFQDLDPEDKAKILRLNGAECYELTNL
jgi:L-fuconolactonase